MGAVLQAVADAWAIERRYFSQASMQQLADPAAAPAAVSAGVLTAFLNRQLYRQSIWRHYTIDGSSPNLVLGAGWT